MTALLTSSLSDRGGDLQSRLLTICIQGCATKREPLAGSLVVGTSALSAAILFPRSAV
jgi:hypothetical protein